MKTSKATLPTKNHPVAALPSLDDNHNNNNNKQTATTTATMIRNPYVKPTSIKSTFQTISTETNKFRQAGQQAQGQHQALLQRLAVGKKQTNDLMESIRVAQDKRGGLQRQFDMLQRQVSVLNYQKTKERAQLEDLTKQITKAKANGQEQRVTDLTNLAALNEECAALLYQQEQLRLISMIHPETATEILLVASADMAAQTGGGGGNDDDSAHDREEAIRDALDSLHVAATGYRQALAQKEAYVNEIYRIRNGILQRPEIDGKPNPWTEDELIKLETKWEQGGDNDDKGTTEPNLFYAVQGGGQDDHNDDHEEEEEEESHEGNPDAYGSTMP